MRRRRGYRALLLGLLETPRRGDVTLKRLGERRRISQKERGEETWVEVVQAGAAGQDPPAEDQG